MAVIEFCGRPSSVCQMSKLAFGAEAAFGLLGSEALAPGVTAATPALRYESFGNVINMTDSGTTVDMLGVDPTSAAAVFTTAATIPVLLWMLWRLWLANSN